MSIVENLVNSQFSLQQSIVNGSTTTDLLIAPLDVSLQNYNTTEFIILVSNVTSGNLSIAQTKFVLTNYAKIHPSVVVTLRILGILFNVWLLISLVMFRNYEPVKSKTFYVSILTLVNCISHIQGIIENLPIMKLFFQSYWTKFITEKQVNPNLDAQTFYNTNLDSKGFPTWMRGYATFENSYCFINNYLLHPLVMMGLALYSIQILKLMMLSVLKDRIQSIEHYWQELKEKQLEKLKTLKTNKSHQHRQQETKQSSFGGAGDGMDVKASPRGISDAQENSLFSTSNSSIMMRPSISGTNNTDDTSSVIGGDDDMQSVIIDGSEDEVASIDDGLSERGRVLNWLKTIIRYKVIEITYTICWGLITIVVLSYRIFVNPSDVQLEKIFNNSWKSLEGYCNYTVRAESGYYVLVLAAILFLSVPIFLIVDCIVSYIKYRKIKSENTKNGIKTENFIVYHYYETDPFVYRSEALVRILFDFLALIVFLILINAGNTDGTVLGIFVALVATVLLHFLGGTFSNPGITIYKTYYNYYLMKRNENSGTTNGTGTTGTGTTNEIKTLEELVKSPVNSFSIDYVISRKQERDLFHQFLKQEFSVENLLFVEDLAKLRKIKERQFRAKFAKIKEMVKLYLSESSSVFEVNIPSKIIHAELKTYRELLAIMNQHGIQLNQLPRTFKEGSTTRYFPQLDQSTEDSIKSLLESLSTVDIFSTLSFETYKNLMDSFYRFKHSRKWLEFVKSNLVQI